MRVRTRLVLAFTYVLIVLVVALGVPLTINLQRRATAELENQALVTAQGIATAIGVATMRPKHRDRLAAIAEEAAGQIGEGARVLIVDTGGIVVADSQTPSRVGEDYATPERPEIVSALERRPLSKIRHSDTLGQDIMATAVPIEDRGRLLGAVRITQSVHEVNLNVRRITLGLLAIGLSALVAGLIMAFGLAESVARPLRRLADAARRLGAGDLSTRAEDVKGATEIAQLGRSFDEMADRLERTVRAQREFVANASHQLRTPLTGMKLRLESAMADAGSEDLRRNLEAADREVDRLSEIVDRLLVMAKEIEEGRPTRLDVGEAVARAVVRWDERARRLGATLLARGEGGTAQGNPADLDQILDNLLDNAISYAPGEVTIESGRADGLIFVAVQDRGPGIGPEEMERVTERFYRGRGAPAGGSGLGLAIARELAEKWGGTLVVSTPDGGGTRVEVSLRPSGAGSAHP